MIYFSWVVQLPSELSALPPRNRNLIEMDCSDAVAVHF